MFDPESRYAEIGNATLETEDGREVSYKKRRFLPRGETVPRLTEVNVKDGDRLDLIASRTLSEPLASWRVADANDAMHPRDLLEAGRALKVPVPQFGEDDLL